MYKIIFYIHFNIAFYITLIFKNNKLVSFEDIKNDAFNYLTINAVYNIINNKQAQINDYSKYQQHLHNALISILEYQTSSRNTVYNLKMNMKMEKSLFFKIIYKPNLKLKANEVMQILHSKIYLFIKASKKLIHQTFTLLFNLEISQEDIYRSYQTYIENDQILCGSDITKNTIFNRILLSANIKKDIKEQMQKCSQSTVIFDPRNYSQCDDDIADNIITNQHSINQELEEKEHPFDQYFKDFFDHIYFYFRIHILGINDAVILILSIFLDIERENFVSVPASIFLNHSILFNEVTDSQIKKRTKKSSAKNFKVEISRYCFLKHFQEYWNNPYIELGYTVFSIASILDQFISHVHPRSVNLIITTVYSHLNLIKITTKDDSIAKQLIDLLHQVSCQVSFFNLYIDTFVIKITKSRIFDLFDISVLSRGSFAPSLHTSICLYVESNNDLLARIASIHLESYEAKNPSIIQFYNYEDVFLSLSFDPHEMWINNIFIKRQTGENIDCVNAVIKSHNCTIELIKFDHDDQTKEELNLKDEAVESMLSPYCISEDTSGPENRIVKTSQCGAVKSVTSFNVSLLDFIHVKSKNKNSSFLLTNIPNTIIQIYNCSTDFSFQPPSNIEKIIIKNSSLSVSYYFDAIKHIFFSKKNTSICLKHVNFVNKNLSGVYKEIKIVNCSSILRIFAQFEVIEIYGFFQDYFISGQFPFHFRSKEYGVFIFNKKEKHVKAVNLIFLNNSFSSFIITKSLFNCTENNGK